MVHFASAIYTYGARKRIGEERGFFQDRKNFSEVVELTSRVSTDKVAEARRRLEAPFHKIERVDCAIATNMVSVGLDIQRLGLMVVQGQPRGLADYDPGRCGWWPGCTQPPSWDPERLCKQAQESRDFVLADLTV